MSVLMAQTALEEPEDSPEVPGVCTSGIPLREPVPGLLTHDFGQRPFTFICSTYCVSVLGSYVGGSREKSLVIKKKIRNDWPRR